ncbi:MAG TPA: DUF2079 domain-containing protein [Candidatus Deferrimicrobiaceae bacterium]|nr:DUF2079 domain-containing protein [Candidatus Deferrimicrobiaceae bacterium]
MTVARLLDAAAVLAAAGLGLALALWSGRREHWPWRPEHLFLLLVGLVALRLLLFPRPVPAIRPRRAVLIGVAGYAVVFSFVTVTRHFTFATHALDLGYYVQLVWNLARGAGPYVSLPEMHAWGDHLSPIMYLFVPAYWVAPGPVVLLVAQSVALALGGIAVFGLARARLGDERPAAAFALLYLANPSLHGINVRDFHAAALAIPLLLAAFWAVETGRPWLALPPAALTLLCREDAALPVIGLGAWMAVAHRRWRVGALTAAAALAVLAVDVRWIIPAYRGQPYSHLGRYAHLGGSLTEIVTNALVHPLRTLGTLTTGRRAVYLAAMLAPLAFLPLRGGWDLLGVLPALAQNLLSADPVLYGYRAQYQSFVLPFLMLAAVGGYARLARRRPGSWPVAVLVVAMVASLALASRTANNLSVARFWPAPEQRAAYQVLARVPPGAAVSAQDPYVPHLSLRPLVFVFPSGIEKSDYVLVNLDSYPWRNLPGVSLTRDGGDVTIAVGPTAHRYRVAAQAGPHLLLRRI